MAMQHWVSKVLIDEAMLSIADLLLGWLISVQAVSVYWAMLVSLQGAAAVIYVGD